MFEKICNRMANSEMSDLPERVQECLKEAGLVSPSSILLLSDSELRKQGNLTVEECVLVRSCAAKSVMNPGFMIDAWHKLEHKWRRLSVGCEQLNSFLEGGIAVRGITEIAGESGSGKTQLCLQLSLTVQYPLSAGGLDGGAVFICTEDVFPSRRLQELFQSFPPRFSKSSDILNFSDSIFIEHIGDVDNLKQCLLVRLPQLLMHRQIKLVVVDSIAGVFRTEYDPSNAINRAKDLQLVGSQLYKLAHKFHLAVVCVNQVSDVCDVPRQKCVPALGLAWANIVRTRLQMTRTLRTVPDPNQSGLEVAVRTLEVVFAPDLPKKSCHFIVTSSGVCGIS